MFLLPSVIDYAPAFNSDDFIKQTKNWCPNVSNTTSWNQEWYLSFTPISTKLTSCFLFLTEDSFSKECLFWHLYCVNNNNNSAKWDRNRQVHCIRMHPHSYQSIYSKKLELADRRILSYISSSSFSSSSSSSFTWSESKWDLLYYFVNDSSTALPAKRSRYAQIIPGYRCSASLLQNKIVFI